MDIDRGNRNYYNCGRFGDLARNCRNRGTEGKIGKGRRLKYGNRNNKERRRIEENRHNNLNGNKNLIVLN